jgi:hypothetical protein
MSKQKAGDINKIIISRKMGRGILGSNKHTYNNQMVAILPRIDSKKEKYQRLILNEKNTFNKFPIAFDFIANTIEAYRKDIETIVKDIGGTSDYFPLEVTPEIISAYIENGSNFTKRQGLRRKLWTEMNSRKGIEITGKNYHGIRSPIIHTGYKDYENGVKVCQYLLLRDVFESLVTGECFKNGGDGFFKIPATLYPILTKLENKGCFKSYNPFYRFILFALMKNSNDVNAIKVNKNEFCQTVIPEYFDPKKERIDMKYCEVQNTFANALKTTKNNIQEKAFFVKNLYIKAYKPEVIIYFETINRN